MTDEILPSRESTVDPKKYITFKRDEFQAHVHTVWLSMPERTPLKWPDEIEDAVVIRTQDVFAGPAFHTYAASIGLVARMLAFTHPEKAQQQQDIADYFHARAEEADEGLRKLPD